MTEIEAQDLFGEEEIEIPAPARQPEVNHPSHYNAGAVECIDAIEAAVTGLDGFEGYCVGNAIKYLWRWKRKGGLTDLGKAAWHINRITDKLSGEGK